METHAAWEGLMGTVRKWEKQKEKSTGKRPDDYVTRKEVMDLVEKKMLDAQAFLPRALTLDELRLEGDLDMAMFDDLAPEQGFIISAPGNSEAAIRWYEDVHRSEGAWTESDTDVPDGLVPDQVTEVKVHSGRHFFLIRWVSVQNNTLVKYNVHVSATAAFTPDDSNLVTTTSGNLVSVKLLTDGSPLVAATPYYIQIVPIDADGAGAASTEVSAELDDEALDDLLVGTVTAEQLEAVLVLANTMIAGALGSSRVEMGEATSEHMNGMIGIHALAADGETITFMINAADGSVYVKGQIGWGSDSELTINDTIQMHRQPIGFEVGAIRQATGNRGNSGTGSVTWNFATLSGSLCLMFLTIYDTDGTSPTPTTPGGWTLVNNEADSTNTMRQLVYKIENASSQSGAQTITLGDTVIWAMDLLEVLGVEVQDATAVDSEGTSASPATGSVSTTVNDTTAFAYFSAKLSSAGSFDGNYTNSFTGVNSNLAVSVSASTIKTRVAAVNLFSTGSISCTTGVSPSTMWIGSIVAFRSKAASVDAPAADKVAIYAKDVAGVPVLHVQDDTGQESSVMLAMPDEGWRFEEHSATHDPASIAANGVGVEDITVSGVAVGDLVIMTRVGALNNGLVIQRPSIVQAADTVRVFIQNVTAGAINPGSGAYDFLIIHRS
jgi:hypothetical protein